MTVDAPIERTRPALLLAAALVVAGFAALCAQVLLLRELMVAWRGNEMSLGISLSVWLASTGAGGFLYAHVSRRRTPGPKVLAGWVSALGLLSPAGLVVARLTRVALGMPAGELTGPTNLALAAVLSIPPVALVGGFVFALTISVMSARGERGTSAVGHAYVLESLGAVAAGVLLSFVLLRSLAPVSIAFISTGLCAAAALGLVGSAGRFGGADAAEQGAHLRDRLHSLEPAGPRARRRRGGLSSRIGPQAAHGAFLAMAIVALATPLGRRVDQLTVAIQWKELGFRSQANSIYGRIITAEVGSQKSVYESGVLAATHPNRMGVEEAIHLTMLQHAAPREVLLVGGCLGGTVKEILKHPSVLSVDCVELDPLLIDEAGRSFGESMTSGLEDPRVNLSYGDARFHVKRAATAQTNYDVAIVSVPDPTTARLNRFYTLEFLQELRACLAKGGVAGLSLTSAENYVSDELADLLACARTTTERVFDEVLLTPGDPCHFFAGNGNSYMTTDPETLSARVVERDLDLVYVRDYYLLDRLSSERRTALASAVSGRDPGPNTDLMPRGYYLSLLLWDRQLSAGRGVLASARSFVSLRSALIAAALLSAFAAVPLARGRPRAAVRSSVFMSVLVVGLTEISLEIAALLAFQSLYGFVYDRVALLVAAFMAGLVLGGRLGVAAARKGWGLRNYIVLQAGIAAVPIALWRSIASIAGLSPDALAAWSNAFPLLVVGAAVLSGIQFPMAARLCLPGGGEPGRLGGRLHGADLTGAALGATLTSVFLLPILGLAGAMTALALLNAGALLALVLSWSGARRAG